MSFVGGGPFDRLRDPDGWLSLSKPRRGWLSLSKSYSAGFSFVRICTMFGCVGSADAYVSVSDGQPT